MDPISNVDKLALILRERLRARADGTGPRRTAREKTVSGPRGMAIVQAVASLTDADERQLKRALIQNILVDEFGPHRINDPKFQQLVGRVTNALSEEPSTSALLDEVIAELRASAR